MKNLFTLKYLLLIVFIVVSNGIIGQVIFTNPITGTNPNTSNPYTIGQNFEGNITVSGIGRGAGINGSNANDRYSARNWSTGGIDMTDYFEFTLTQIAELQLILQVLLIPVSCPQVLQVLLFDQV
jgi:hypothetical protein